MTPRGAAAERPRGGVRGWLPPAARLREAALVVGGFGLLAVVISWPLVANIGTTITGGGSGGDPSGYAWDLWNNATQGLGFWGTTTQEIVSAPFGRESPSAVNVTLLATVGPGWVLATLFGHVAAYNVLALAGLTLSAASMYLLVRWLGLGVAPAIWAGTAYMVFPYEQLRAVAHLPLAQIWCFPLLIIAGVRWIEAPSWRRAGWLTAALAGCWLTNPYYGIMGLVMVGVIVAAGAVVMARRRGLRGVPVPLLQVGVWVVGAIAVPLALLQASSRGALDTSLQRSAIELELYGARLRDYVVPNADNTFFSGLVGAENWASVGSPGGERTAFVGYCTLVLAVIGLVVVVRRTPAAGARARRAAILAVPLVAVLVVFSLASPTRAFGVAITMPSSLVFEVAPYLRVFARFAAPVMAVLLVPAALGLFALLRGRSSLVRASVMSVVLIVSAVELPNGAPGFDLVPSGPPVLVAGREADEVPSWLWLRDNRPGEIVFEQPGAPNEFVERYFMYGQTVHGHPITNGSLAVASIATDLMRSNADVTWPGVPERLAGLGIPLVTVNPWMYGAAGLTPPASVPPGFRVAASFDDGSAVWDVSAAPADAVAIPRADGWWDPELIDGAVWRWMHKRALTTVVAPAAGVYELGFRARAGHGRVHRLTVEGPDGVLGVATVRPRASRVTIRVPLMAGRTDLWTVSDLAPRFLSATDRRVVSMQLTDWTLTRAG